MGVGTEIMLRMTIIVAVIGSIEGYWLMRNPDKLSWAYIILVIIITLAAVACSVWWVVNKYNLGW